VGEGLQKRLTVALVCAILGAGLSGLLLFQHHGEATAVSAVNEMCGDGTTSGCEQVARSSWSSLRGIPVAAFGFVFSLVLASAFVLALPSGSEAKGALASLALVLLGAGLGVDLALAGVQAFVVKAFCGLCTATYVLNAVAFAVLWPARGALAAAPRVLGSGGNRPVLAGLVLAVVAFAASVGGLEQALEARASLRSASLLGAAPASVSSAPALPPESAAGGAREGEAERWRAEARRLQGILDDPQQLDQYFADKAAREYAQAKVESLDLEDVPAKGAAQAPVQVVEYSDFLCPYCRSLAGALQNFLPQSGNRVQIFYKNYPLEKDCNPSVQRSAHVGACNLARGAICAHEQGKFWPYHDRVFAKPQENATLDDVVRLAGEVGLDPGAFSTCLSAPRTSERLAAQIAEARRAGVQATPTLFVNGKKLPRINDFLQVVDKEAQAKGFPPLQHAASSDGSR
jgi:protein-disulfide isomerase/uncharacterized membrane protein